MTDTGQVPGEGLPENAGGQQEMPPYAAPATPAGSGLPERPGGAPAQGAYAFHDPAESGAGGGEEEDALLMPGAQGAWGDLPAGAVPSQAQAYQRPQAQANVPSAAGPSAGYPQQASGHPQAQPSPYASAGHPHAYVPPQAQQSADSGAYEPGILGHAPTHTGTPAGTHETGGRDTGSVDYGAVRMPQQSSVSQSVSRPMAAPSHPAPVSATPPAGTPTPGRRPLHRGPQAPDTSGGVVRSLADRGPAGAPAQGAVPSVPASGPVPGPEYLDVPPGESAVALSMAAYADQYAASLPGPQLGEIPPQSAHWDMQPAPDGAAGPADHAPASAAAPQAHDAAGRAVVDPAASATANHLATGGGSGADGAADVPYQAPEPQPAQGDPGQAGHVPAGSGAASLHEPPLPQSGGPVPQTASAQDPSAHPESGHGQLPGGDVDGEPPAADEGVNGGGMHGRTAGAADGSVAAGSADGAAVTNAAWTVTEAAWTVTEVTTQGVQQHAAAAQPGDVQPTTTEPPLHVTEPHQSAASGAPGPEAARPAETEEAPAARSDVAPEATGGTPAQPQEPVGEQASDTSEVQSESPAGEPESGSAPEAAAPSWPEPPAERETQPEPRPAADPQQGQDAAPVAEPVPATEPVATTTAPGTGTPGSADQEEPGAGHRPVLADELVAPKSRPQQPAAEPAAEPVAAAAAADQEGAQAADHDAATAADAEVPVDPPASIDAETPVVAETPADAEASGDRAVDVPDAYDAGAADGRAPAEGYGDAEREAVLRVIRERRDIRNGFRSDPIPHDVLLRVLEAAHTAPSVGHSQPWDFVVIRSAETRRTMHELAMRQREAYAQSLPKGRAKQFKQLKIEAILDTPVNIVVTADPTRGGRHTLGRHTQPQMAPYSSALAVENLWLAARAEGLGVGWVSFFDEREMVRALGLPDHLEVVAYLCVGYVDEFPDEPELMQAGWSKRRPLSWVVHEETYGRRALPGAEPHDLLAETLQGIRPLDAKALGEAWERQKRMTKPAGALGMLEIISAQLSGLSRQCPPPIPEPAAVAIFAGDHGVHAQGVTPWPQEVTAQMVANFLGGGAVCNAFANQVGAEVCIVDVGVAGELPSTPGLLPRKVRPGTGDFTAGPALTQEEVLRAIEVGIETARDLVAAGNKALLSGEMGIANTTVSAALISVYTDLDPSEVTGRGTGINDETHARKVDVVRRALELHQPDPADPIGVLAAVGGLEHAAIVGLLLGAASLRTPVILDGVSAGAAALVARAIAPEVLAACIAGHRSAEPGHVAALTKLGLRPLVDLDLRLGEGTGALLALPLVQSAARAMHEVATFDSAGVTEKA
ncbi:nicotinate-nucleotide--dimethylbenzimidazole phosphoribosyltransferase [Streptomyces sp. NPDC051776]|uniref:nicotinate-nucleotide--dimethylbenzimidazole phosphoribosyltransferase n=1 Tax=Streptomyces sp. NPDC051776 TaxID=3155414 RepID=UPI00343E0C31